MKISILIPIYNVEKYLRQCLDSILNQKDIKDVALDIVLVDDGSTDKSLDIAIEYAKKDERIFVLSKKNAGLSTARNAAIELMKGTKLRAYLENEIKENDFSIKSYKNTHSFDKTDIKKISKEDIDKNFIKLDERVYKTELSDINDLILQDLPDDVYVHFLDSDDYLDESCISTCKRYIQEKDLNLYLHNLSSVDENSKLIKEKIYLALNLKLGFYDNGLDFLQSNKLHDFYFAYQGAFRASLLNLYKLRFIRHIYHEDHDFAIILFSLSQRLFVDDKVLLYYRSRSGSIISSMQDDSYPKNLPFYLEPLKESFKSYKELRRYYKAYGMLRAFKEIYKLRNVFKKGFYKKMYYYYLHQFILNYQYFFDKIESEEKEKNIKLLKGIEVKNINHLYLKFKLIELYRHPKLLFKKKKD
ncbi:glycosyltransferase, family 2 [Campylobacter avium LMG 24591]|uniref:Glycosyltransferase, family 2 n=1 Tax=Campylobacter avium LMG 24591 TaxID=522484 RepID=A0A222MZ86_9BACT|nr:glycosyltransferase family 2 protein [Campylobacter avium]ASQ31038.1 glycosyltransferase, family 2 [Campylobacter avium LMG 24591]OYD78420.1 glycosyltransferase, family 2 [Campylobacter avium]